MFVVKKNLSFIAKELSDWYREHFRAFELCTALQVQWGKKVFSQPPIVQVRPLSLPTKGI